MEELRLDYRRNPTAVSGMNAAKEYSKPPIFTCKSATEELGQKAMLLRDSFDLVCGEMVSLVGSGDKTTTLFRLAKELRDQGWNVLVTTTAHIVKPTKPHIDRLFLVDELQSLVDVCSEIVAPAMIGTGRGENQASELRACRGIGSID